MKTLQDLDAYFEANDKCETVLLRVDFNVDVDKVTEDNRRIQDCLPTICHLVKRNKKVVLLSHFESSMYRSFSCLEDFFEKVLKKHVECTFSFFVFKNTDESVAEFKKLKESLPGGSVILLENLRGHPEEKDNDPKFAERLASLGDVYVNEALSCSHREHASIAGIPKYIPSFAGLRFSEDVQKLKSIPGKECGKVTVIIGGAKVSTKIQALWGMVSRSRVDNVLLGGAMANTFLAAKGFGLGSSVYDDRMLDCACEIMSLASKKKCRIMLPIDLCVTEHAYGDLTKANYLKIRYDGLDSASYVRLTSGFVCDVGPLTIESFKMVVDRSNIIIFNGPLGSINNGTYSIMQSMALKTMVAVTVLGGGHTLDVASIDTSYFYDKLTHLFSAGGAMLRFLAGEKLPGIEALG